MKKIVALLIIMAAAILIAGPAMAMDIEALDKVNILMSKSEVKAMLGEPDHNQEIISGLMADVYTVKGLGPMVGAGCIYDGDNLVGQAFLFEGATAEAALERMKTHGFIHYSKEDGVNRLLGKDDDTGEPIVVVILEEGGLTTVITFEKSYYEATLKEKKAQ
jgi:hypothetical protein